MSKKIDLIFTRDFSLAISDFWHFLLSKKIKEEFGKGLSQQIDRFTGRTSEIYRVRDELNGVKKAVISKNPDAFLFSKKRTNQFRKDIKRLKEITKIRGSISQQMAHFCEVKKRFISMYPMYMLSVFLPNPWREDFKKQHPENGEHILKQIYQNRVYSEGTYELTDNYFRYIIAKLLEQRGISGKFARLVRFSEFEDLMRGKMSFTKSMLVKRANEYILFKNELFVGKNFEDFLKENDFEYKFNVKKNIKEFSGQVGCPGKIVCGKVKIILNVNEIKKIKKGDILVTAMTSPDYLAIMKQARAIVTDEGGITCHAAIVSRELNIPCIIGTKIATKVLRDGDVVEVDATRGVIKKLK